MTTYHSQDLGWVAGQNVESGIRAQFDLMTAGDVLVLDHFYEITGKKIVMPDGITLAGGNPGAGLDLMDPTVDQSHTFTLADDITLLDLTLTSSPCPDTGYGGLDPEAGVDYYVRDFFESSGSPANLTIRNCRFQNNILFFVDSYGGSNWLIEDTDFIGSDTPLRLQGPFTGVTINRCLFKEYLRDGIKTSAGPNAAHLSDMQVNDTVFINGNRDAIDTTGGFRNSTVSGCYILNAFAGIDIKEIYDSDDDFDFGGPRNINILVENTYFWRCNSCVVVTTLDRGDPPYLTVENGQDWCVADVHMENCTANSDKGDLGGPNRVFLIKDSKNTSWNNITHYGSRASEYSVSDDLGIGLPVNYGGTNYVQDDTQTGPHESDEYYESLAGASLDDISDYTYPTPGFMPPPAGDTEYSGSLQIVFNG